MTFVEREDYSTRPYLQEETSFMEDKDEVNALPKSSFDNSCATIDNNDLDLPIALTKGTQDCTKHHLYPLAQFVSYDRLSHSYRAFLTQLNTVTIHKTLPKALNNKKRRQVISVEMEALEKNKTWE